MTEFKFGTAINCIDGRTQEAIINHMKRNHGVDGVDLVTFPGVDGILSSSYRNKEEEKRSSEEIIVPIRRAVSISVEKHGSRIIAIVGHHDCAGNPGDREHHYAGIGNAMREVSSWNFPVQVVGYYVNDKQEIEEVK